MKTIFITVFHSFISKNFLNTEAFKSILNIKDLRIIFLVPKLKEDYFKREFNFENVEVVSVNNIDLLKEKKVKYYSRISHLLQKSHYLWYKKVERLNSNKTILGYIKYYAEIVFTFLFGNRKLFRRLLRFFFIKKMIISSISEIFEKYSPDLFFSTDAFDEMDVLFSAEAKRRGIYTLSMVRSWDNCYSKGVLRVIPNRLMVNNFNIKDEAIKLHDINESDIEVVGIPQYDDFIRGERSKKTDFFNKIGADINKKLILFSPAGTILSDTDSDICLILNDFLDKRLIIKPCQVLVRNHPNHPADLSSLSKTKNIIVDYPGKMFGDNLKDTELTRLDSKHLGDTLFYSDLVIYTATTLGIDSLIFDKPQIIIDFDGFKTKPYTQSVKRYHDEDHMKKMLKLGGVKIVKNKEDLLKSINEYLNNPEKDRVARKLVFEQQIYFKDGLSGERVAKVLKDLISF